MISMSRRLYSKVKLINNIVCIPKPWKKPPENYVEPLVWNLKFPQPSQVLPRAFLDCCRPSKLGPSKEVDKTKTYKNPEYYSYHTYSYYNMEEDLNCKRCRAQPSPFSKVKVYLSEKCP